MVTKSQGTFWKFPRMTKSLRQAPGKVRLTITRIVPRKQGIMTYTLFVKHLWMRMGRRWKGILQPRKWEVKHNNVRQLKGVSWLQSRSRRDISTRRGKGRTLWDSTRWSLRLRCAEIGNWPGSAFSKTLVPSPMGSTNWWKSNTSHKTLKQNRVSSSIRLASVPTATGASSCTPSMTFMISKT